MTGAAEMELWTLWKLHRCYLEDCFSVGQLVVREVGRADVTWPAPGLVEEGRKRKATQLCSSQANSSVEQQLRRMVT